MSESTTFYAWAARRSFSDDGLTASQRYYARHRAKRNAESREYKRRNKARVVARHREYRRRNPERFKGYESKRVRPEGHKEKFNAYKREWNRKNPDKRLASYQKRRAGLLETIPASALTAIRQTQNGECAYCHGPLGNRGRGHLDHRTPISRGGRHVVENVCFACPACNLAKGVKTAVEFLTFRRAA